MLKRGAVFLSLILGGVALAQESAHFKIKGPVLNAGGDPRGGLNPASASYVLRPDALNESATGGGMSSASFLGSGGFVLSFPPPGEIHNLVFDDSVTLAWDPDQFAAHYHLYRTPAMGPGAGVAPSPACLQPDVLTPTATDPDVPGPGLAYFYVATAVNCIRLEGPDSSLGLRCE